MSVPQIDYMRQFNRQFAASLDSTEVFNTLEEAQEYAFSYPSRYAGQKISWTDSDGKERTGVVQSNGSLEPIPLNSDIESLQSKSYRRLLQPGVDFQGNICNIYININLGNDNNDGLSIDRPFKSYSKAIEFIKSCDFSSCYVRLNFATGRYVETLGANFELVGVTHLSFFGENKDTTIIQGRFAGGGQSIKFTFSDLTIETHGAAPCFTVDEGALVILNNIICKSNKGIANTGGIVRLSNTVTFVPQSGSKANYCFEISGSKGVIDHNLHGVIDFPMPLSFTEAYINAPKGGEYRYHFANDYFINKKNVSGVKYKLHNNFTYSLNTPLSELPGTIEGTYCYGTAFSNPHTIEQFSETDPLNPDESILTWRGHTLTSATVYPSGFNLLADQDVDSELISRTIYVEKTGDDETGNGKSKATAFASLEKALGDVKPNLFANINIVVGPGNFDLSSLSAFKFYSYGGSLNIYGSAEEYDAYEMTIDTVDTQKAYLKKNGVDVNLPENELKGLFHRNASVATLPNGLSEAYPISESNANYFISILDGSEMANFNTVIRLTTTFIEYKYDKITVFPISAPPKSSTLIFRHLKMEASMPDDANATFALPLNVKSAYSYWDYRNIKVDIYGTVHGLYFKCFNTIPDYQFRLYGVSDTINSTATYVVLEGKQIALGCRGIRTSNAYPKYDSNLTCTGSSWVAYSGQMIGSPKIIRIGEAGGSYSVISISNGSKLNIDTVVLPANIKNFFTWSSKTDDLHSGSNIEITVKKMICDTKVQNNLFGPAISDDGMISRFPKNYTKFDGSIGEEVITTLAGIQPTVTIAPNSTSKVTIGSRNYFKTIEIEWIATRTGAISQNNFNTKCIARGKLIAAQHVTFWNSNSQLLFSEVERMESDILVGISFNIIPTEKRDSAPQYLQITATTPDASNSIYSSDIEFQWRVKTINK